MKKFITILVLCGIIQISYAIDDKSKVNKTTTLSGYVQDVESGEYLTGVQISIDGTDEDIYTDFDGYFVIPDLMPGVYNICINYVSYQKQIIKKIRIREGKSKDLNIKLHSLVGKQMK